MGDERAAERIGRIVLHPVALWLAFLVVHVWLSLLNLYADGFPMGDVSHVYRFWSDQVFVAGFWVGVDSSWVYPVLAIFPMLGAAVLGPELYPVTWLYLVTIGNAVGFAFLIGMRRTARYPVAAWWWLAFLVALGPITLGRIDSVTVPLALIGGLLLASHPRAAAIVLTVGAWVKVWPGAIFLAAVVLLRRRLQVLVSGFLVSAAIVLVALVAGSGMHVFGFITQQTGRGVQVEAPVASIWLWQAFAGVRGAEVYYDRRILTWQVNGVGVEAVSALMTPLMLLAVALCMLIAVRALRRGARVAELLAPLTLALVAALIVFNKVGSPQFITWLAVPVILGLVGGARGLGGSFAVPALLVTVIGGLTQFVYPYLYGYLLSLHPLLLTALGIRNLLVVVVLVWSVHALWRAADDPCEEDRRSAPIRAAEAWPWAGPAEPALRSPAERPSP